MTISHTISRTITFAWGEEPTATEVVVYFDSYRQGQGHGRQGETTEADDGSSRTTVTGRKRRYVYSLDKSTPALFDALLALPDTFSVTDHNGDTWDAEVPIGSPTWTVTHGDAAGLAGTEYTIELEVRER